MRNNCVAAENCGMYRRGGAVERAVAAPDVDMPAPDDGVSGGPVVAAGLSLGCPFVSVGADMAAGHPGASCDGCGEG